MYNHNDHVRERLKQIYLRWGLRTIMVTNSAGDELYHVNPEDPSKDEEGSSFSLLSMYMAAISQVGSLATGNETSSAIISIKGNKVKIYLLRKNDLILFIIYEPPRISDKDLEKISDLILEYISFSLDSNFIDQFVASHVKYNEITIKIVQIIEEHLEKSLQEEEQKEEVEKNNFDLSSLEEHELIELYKEIKSQSRLISLKKFMTDDLPLNIFLTEYKGLNVDLLLRVNHNMNFMVLDRLGNMAFKLNNLSSEDSIFDYIREYLLSAFECIICPIKNCLRRIKVEQFVSPKKDTIYTTTIDGHVIFFQVVLESFLLVAFTSTKNSKLREIYSERFADLYTYLSRILAIKLKRFKKETDISEATIKIKFND